MCLLRFAWGFGPCFWGSGAVGGTQDNFWKNNVLVPAQEYNWDLPCIGTKPVWPNERWKVEIGWPKDSRYVEVGSGLEIELEGLMHSPSPQNKPHKVYVMHDQQMLLLEISREGVAWQTEEVTKTKLQCVTWCETNNKQGTWKIDFIYSFTKCVTWTFIVNTLPFGYGCMAQRF